MAGYRTVDELMDILEEECLEFDAIVSIVGGNNKYEYQVITVPKKNVHINFKPGNHTPLGMWRKGLFLQKNKKYLILLLSPEKFVILNMREHKLMKSAERRDTDASKRTGRDDIHKSKTVS